MSAPRSERDHPGGDRQVHTLMAVCSQIPRGKRGDDVLAMPSQTGEGLDTIIARDIFQKAAIHAGSQHCSIEAEVVSLDNPDRS